MWLTKGLFSQILYVPLIQLVRHENTGKMGNHKTHSQTGHSPIKNHVITDSSMLFYSSHWQLDSIADKF